VRARDAGAAERLAAEAYAAGAVGLEEREGAEGIRLVVYAPAAAAAAVARALRAHPGDALVLRGPEPEPGVDWSEAWKQGLEVVEVSAHLRIRPSFRPARPPPGGVELVIDPGQAFGTGGHPSTRLALEWVDALAPELRAADRVLDVGAGTGVLALVAVARGPARALALDLDPVAVPEARANAVRNGLAGRVAFAVGSADAVASGAADLVVANLLRTELLPIRRELVACARPGARGVFSGLLAREEAEVSAALVEAGFRPLASRRMADAGGEEWVALLTRR